MKICTQEMVIFSLDSLMLLEKHWLAKSFYNQQRRKQDWRPFSAMIASKTNWNTISPKKPKGIIKKPKELLKNPKEPNIITRVV